MKAKHHGVVTYTHRLRDLFRKRYWVHCWYCNDVTEGPYETREEANTIRNTLDTIDCFGYTEGEAWDAPSEMI